MEIYNPLYLVTGEKIESLLVTEYALLLSSSKYYSEEEFMEGWNKKLTLYTKTEIKFDDIRSIKVESNSNELTIRCKGVLGNKDVIFTFEEESEKDEFLELMVKRQFFTRNEEQLSSFSAISTQLIAIGLSIAITAFFAYMATQPKEEVVHSRRAKGRIVEAIIEFLGLPGILAVGGAVTLFYAYKAWKRHNNPPVEISYLPPNQ